MTTNHIDQLAQWYADAEQVTKTNLPRKGDTLIYPRRTSGYIIESDGGGWAPEFVHSAGETVRILARAPEPKPAWHDAPAVIATGDAGDGDWITGVWVPDGTPERWESAETGIILRCEGLSDVVPLIEAKVTDEMVARAMAFWDPNCPGEYDADDIQWAREFITAALGLEAE